METFAYRAMIELLTYSERDRSKPRTTEFPFLSGYNCTWETTNNVECLLCWCKQKLWQRVVAKKVFYILQRSTGQTERLSLTWSSIWPINGQITRITLLGYSPSQIFFCSFTACGEQLKNSFHLKNSYQNRLASLQKHPSLPVNNSQLFSALVLV